MYNATIVDGGNNMQSQNVGVSVNGESCTFV